MISPREVLSNGSLLLTGGTDPSVALGTGMRSSFKCRARNRAGTALSTTATVLSGEYCYSLLFRLIKITFMISLRIISI